MTTPVAFAVTRITLTDYRNYAALRLDPPLGLMALVGPNGAGKTNLLEAVSLLTPGRGLRGADFASLGRSEGEGAWAVSARVKGPDGECQLGTAWTRAEDVMEQQPRAVLIDGSLQKSSGALAGRLPLVWLTPQLDRLFSGPASERRRYLDRMVALFDIAHITRVSAFEKLMRERNLLLQSDRPDRAWLVTLEMQMAEHAIAIAAARLNAVEKLGRWLTPQNILSPFPWSTIAVTGDSEDMVQRLPALAAEQAYRKILEEGRAIDRAAGRTLQGPHRSDLSVRHGPKDMAAGEGSTGEQKALLIGLILAQAQAMRGLTGWAPILLLDEVSAHLDKTRRSALLSQLKSLHIQAWMTGTDHDVFDGAGLLSMVYHVDHGTIRESKS